MLPIYTGVQGACTKQAESQQYGFMSYGKIKGGMQNQFGFHPKVDNDSHV